MFRAQQSGVGGGGNVQEDGHGEAGGKPDATLGIRRGIGAAACILKPKSRSEAVSVERAVQQPQVCSQGESLTEEMEGPERPLAVWV